MQYTVPSPEAMIELGRTLVQSGYKKFGLRGGLGAGKTHFTKGVALGLGLDDVQVHSPTYVYFHEYDKATSYQLLATDIDLVSSDIHNDIALQEADSRKLTTGNCLLHVDMYRMADMFQIIKIGLDDKLAEYEYRCIEWPSDEFLGEYGQDMMLIDISIKDQYNRIVTVTAI